jgi:CHAT domain-containing protein
VCDPSGEAECMVKEGRWVANHFNQSLDAPCASVFDALHTLKQSRQAHLATHGNFNRADPTASYLTLEKNQRLYFPLWMISAIQTSADFVMLSACESNLNGQDTEGLLTPIGIGPSLAAAGAKTVVGTLWPCDGVAAIFFSHHFYTIAKANPNLPWHQVATQARLKLKEMTTEQVEELAEKMDLYDKNDECRHTIAWFESSDISGEHPFEKHFFWAGFTVLGQVYRGG